MSSSPTPAANRRRAGAELAIAWLGLFGLFAVIALFAFSIARDREDLVADTEKRGQLEAVLLADHAARLLEAADLAMSTVVDDIRGLNRADVILSRRAHDRFRRLAERLPYVEAIWFHGADGTLWMTSLAFPAPPQTALQTDFLVTHGSGETELFIGDPVANTFRLSRRIEDSRGEFKGVASLTISAQFFQRFYRRLDLPPGSIVTLLNARTLAPLVQAPPGAGGPGAIIHDVARLREATRREPDHGTFRSVSPVDRVDRVYAYRKTPGYPLYLKISVPLGSLNDQWTDRIRGHIATAVAAIAGLGVLTWLGFRQAGQQRRFQNSLSKRVLERTSQLEHAIQEVHHRVNNNLQIVSTLLTVQLGRVGDPQVREALAEGIGRVNTIGLAHQVMYGSGAVTELAFGDYLRKMAEQIVDLYGFDTGVIEVRGANPLLTLETSVPLALMVHEVLAAGMRGGRRVVVDLDVEGPRWSISISGIEPMPPGAMAADIISLLAGQLGAHTHTEEAAGNGVTFMASWTRP